MLRIAHNLSVRKLGVLRASAARLSTAAGDAGVYTGAMKWMHWITGGAVLGCFGTVQMAMNTKDKKQKGKLMKLHKSMGLVVAGLVVPRVGMRLTSALPGHLPGSSFEQMAATASHGLFYVFMITMPATGIAMGYYGGKGLPFFGYKIPGKPKAQRTKDDGAIAKNSFKLHKQAGQLFEYLTPIHIGAAAFHSIKGQAIFRRIIPGM
uniref:Cytochrome b561 bacterial/Ni-hydrogenase domain-containing protein n=2 Tax=Lotharella oceanica TaxID=641309 RepID=A0A7S2TWJ3_9EUKA|mmetsp:Transcript_31316/g.58379  ORF Transcript_31316/g.58379 Transcript_31316/m.58379 type:complete len:207 (+) Transcript_31316:44-664(+)